MAFVQLFGNELCSAGGRVSTKEALEGKVVGIYFSAHWCPPCRGFTPKLAEWYTSSLAAKGLEVVFVSSDHDQAAFDEYFGSMPWKALPFDDREKKAALSKKFKVQGIPTFVILDKDGSVITRDGRSAVSNDPTGEDFPWKPKPFHELLGSSFTGQNGASLGKSAVDGKVLGLYFSAHWCPPCKAFTPQLAAWYKKISPKHPDFEIIFVSSDRDEGAFKEYFAEMPWIALPYADRKAKEQLSNFFGVEGIPTFVIVDKDGSVINANGRGIPSADPEGQEFPWHPKPVQSLSEPEGINDTPALVVLVDGVDAATRKAVEDALNVVGAEYAQKAKQSEEDKILFFVGDENSEPILSQVRRLTKLEADASNPAVAGALLDLGDEGAYYSAADVDFKDANSVRAFLQKFQAKSLTRIQVE